MDNAVKQVQTEHILSDEMIDLIIEREEYAEQNPDCWIDYEKAMKELRDL